MRGPCRKARSFLAGASFLTMSLLPPYAHGANLELTLAEAVRMAAERNLDVKAELYNPAIAEATVRQYQGIYDPKLTLSTGYRDSTTLPASTLLAGASTNEQQTLTYSAGVSQLLPIGGTIGASFTNSWYQSNADPAKGFMNRYFDSGVTLNLSQPLLKNLGREATELNISVAGYGTGVSREQFATKLTDLVAQVRTGYHRLYTLREELEVKRSSLKLAETILADTRGRVKAGVLASMEILNAEYGVASREKELIDAERSVRDQEDLLRLLLQLKGTDELVPVDLPATAPLELPVEEMIRRALTSRTELKAARLNLRINELQSRVAENRTLPDLNLTGSVGTTGLASEYGRTLERVGSTDYPVWSVGLQLDIPLGNREAKNTLIRNRLQTEQGRTQLSSLEESIANEVRSAVRAVDSGYRQLGVTDKARAYAEERLQAFVRKNQVGLATTKDVLDVENDLVTAKSNQITARAEYADSVTQLWKSTGELLERAGITLTGREGERLSEEYRGGTSRGQGEEVAVNAGHDLR